MSKRVLLINDQPSYGNVALAAMVPILAHMGFETMCLPTALVSNTLDYGKFHILETTDYMAETLKVWESLDFDVQAVSTGFMVSQSQTELVIGVCNRLSDQGKPVFCDPIMGDDGTLYNGVLPQTVDLMRQLVAVSHYTVPNYTEACALTGIPYRPEGMDPQQARQLIDGMRELGAKTVVITSALLTSPTPQQCVIGYDHTADSYFRLPFEPIPVRYPGTGDIFSAVFMGKILLGLPVAEATQMSMDAVKSMIAEHGRLDGAFSGIPVGSFLHLIP